MGPPISELIFHTERGIERTKKFQFTLIDGDKNRGNSLVGYITLYELFQNNHFLKVYRIEKIIGKWNKLEESLMVIK